MFQRTRIIRGRAYLYEEERWRENGKVKSRSRLLQALGQMLTPPTDEEKGQRAGERAMDAWEKKQAEKEKAAKEKAPPSKGGAEDTKQSSSDEAEPPSTETKGEDEAQ